MVSNADKKFDLEDRTGKFGEEVLKFGKTIPVTPIGAPLISQLVRAATSVGANYCEANNAVSKKDFLLKIGLCKKESAEAKHWLNGDRRLSRIERPRVKALG